MVPWRPVKAARWKLLSGSWHPIATALPATLPPSLMNHTNATHWLKWKAAGLGSLLRKCSSCPIHDQNWPTLLWEVSDWRGPNFVQLDWNHAETPVLELLLPSHCFRLRHQGWGCVHFQFSEFGRAGFKRTEGNFAGRKRVSYCLEFKSFF